MSIFSKKKHILPVPEGCEGFEISVDKSICTGEVTVGFRNPSTGKLMYAELAENDAAVEAFKKKYGKAEGEEK